MAPESGKFPGALFFVFPTLGHFPRLPFYIIVSYDIS